MNKKSPPEIVQSVADAVPVTAATLPAYAIPTAVRINLADIEPSQAAVAKTKDCIVIDESNDADSSTSHGSGRKKKGDNDALYKSTEAPSIIFMDSLKAHRTQNVSSSIRK